jgi:hypothetical protein
MPERCQLCWSVGVAALSLTAAAAPSPAPTDDAYADGVESFDPGVGGIEGYVHCEAALGAPARTTGGAIFPSVVSIYNPPWLPDEIVSIGQGGSLVIRFDTPVADDPANPFGIDLLIFGNSFFVDDGSGISGLFADGGLIEVSADNARWFALTPAADGLHPTQGFADSGPYDPLPGRVATDFRRPVDPALTLEDFLGSSYEEALALYAGGSGGGTGIDLGPSGLGAISYVRISNGRARLSVEIDALADVAPQVPGDTNGDGLVDVQDLVAVIAQWGPVGPGATADLNGDGLVDVADLVLVVTAWS